MKAILTILVICVSAAVYGHVTRREVVTAKKQYKRDVWADKRAMDSLYWRGLKAIRHDQKFWIIKR